MAWLEVFQRAPHPPQFVGSKENYLPKTSDLKRRISFKSKTSHPFKVARPLFNRQGPIHQPTSLSASRCVQWTTGNEASERFPTCKPILTMLFRQQVAFNSRRRRAPMFTGKLSPPVCEKPVPKWNSGRSQVLARALLVVLTPK